MRESQELPKELILKDIHISLIDDEALWGGLWGGLSAVFDGDTYHVEFNYDMEYGAEIIMVFLEGPGQSKQFCGSNIPAGLYSRIINAYIIDYVNNFFTQSSNETHIFITEDDLAKPNWQLLNKNK